jgi:hypothetical protein
VEVLLRARGRTWPAQVPLVGPALTRAFIARCTYVDVHELHANGWALPGQ